MKILLINNDAMVAKLFEAIAKKVGLGLIVKDEFKELETPEELLLFIDDGITGNISAFLKSQKHIFSVYLHKRNSSPMEGFNFCIKKPFLPTEILDIIKPKLEQSGVIQKSFDDITKDDLEDPSTSKNEIRSLDLEDMPEFNLDELDKLLDDEPQADSLDKKNDISQDDDLSDLIEIKDEDLDESQNLSQENDLSDLIEIKDENLDESQNLSIKNSQEQTQKIPKEKDSKKSLNTLEDDFLDKIDSLQEDKNLEDPQTLKNSSDQDLPLDLELMEDDSFEEIKDKPSIEEPIEISDRDLEEDFKNDIEKDLLQEDDEQKDDENKALDDKHFLADKQDTQDENHEDLNSLTEQDHDETDSFIDENDLDPDELQEMPNIQDEKEPKESKPQNPKTRKKSKPVKKSKAPAKPKKKKETPKTDKPTQEDKEHLSIDLDAHQDVFDEDMPSNVLDKKEIDEVKKILEQTEGTKDSPIKQESEVIDIEDISEEEMMEALGLKDSLISSKNTKPSQKQDSLKESDNIHFECKDEAHNAISLDKDVIETIKNTPLGELKKIFDGMEMNINIKFSGKKNEKNG